MAKADIQKAEAFFVDDAETIVVAYGITARAAKDAVVQARREGIRAGLLRPITLWPSEQAILPELFDRVGKIVVPELNLGQYVLEVQRLAYESARRREKVPPEVVPINRVDMQLITPLQVLQELRS